MKTKLTIQGIREVVGYTLLFFSFQMLISSLPDIDSSFFKQIEITQPIQGIILCILALAILKIRNIISSLKSLFSNKIKVLKNLSIFIFVICLLGFYFLHTITPYSAIFVLIMLICICVFQKTNSLLFEENRNEESETIDSAIQNPKNDCLNRDIFSQEIFKVIENQPQDTNLRIGITGEWGSGKTTVLNFIRYYCTQANYPTAFFQPWLFSNKDEAWKGFVTSVNEGYNVWKEKKTHNFWGLITGNKIIKKIRSVVTDINIIGKAFDALILSRIDDSLTATKERIEKKLSSILGDKKFIIFIDDLDRADSTVVYNLLMVINEIVNIRGCIYILGFEEEQVQRLLQVNNFIINNKFLEKIININYKLPNLISENTEKIIGRELDLLNSVLSRELFHDIVNTLPNNPRKVKKFIRYFDINYRNRITQKFDDDELNMKIVYIGQVLDYFYKPVFNELINSEKIIDSLKMGLFNNTEKDKEQDEENIMTLLSCIENSNSEDNQIVRNIYFLMKNESAYNTLKLSLDVFRLPSDFLSWKLYRYYVTKLLSLSSTEQKKEYISTNIFLSFDFNKIQKEAFIEMVMYDRNNIIDIAVEEYYEDKIKDNIKTAIEMTDICKFIVTEHSTYFTIDIFKKWISSLSKFSKFEYPSYYMTLRIKERELLLLLVDKLSDKFLDIIPILDEYINDSINRNSIAFIETYKKAKTSLENKMVDYLLSLFISKDGIYKLWGVDKCIIEKKYLFESNSVFHEKENHKKLEYMITLNKDNENTVYNCLEFIRMLNYIYLKRPQSYESIEGLYINYYEGFLKFIWETAISKPMNYRFVNSENDDIMKIREKCKKDELFTTPKWWKQLLSKEYVE